MTVFVFIAYLFVPRFFNSKAGNFFIDDFTNQEEKDSGNYVRKPIVVCYFNTIKQFVMIKGKPLYQSEKISVVPTMITAVEKYLNTHNLGNRGVEDGNKRKQLVGLIGEILVIQKLTGQAVNLNEREDGFDGGFDFTYKGHRIDVKTMERRSFVRADFVNNFYIMQEAYEADTVVFCSYHASENILEICGWIYKKDLSKLGKFYKAGTKRVRADQSSFKFRQDNYEVKNKVLRHIRELLSL